MELFILVLSFIDSHIVGSSLSYTLYLCDAFILLLMMDEKEMTSMAIKELELIT